MEGKQPKLTTAPTPGQREADMAAITKAQTSTKHSRSVPSSPAPTRKLNSAPSSGAKATSPRSTHGNTLPPTGKRHTRGPGSGGSSVCSGGGSNENVCVALHIRPMVEKETAEGCLCLLEVDPDGKPELSVTLSSRKTYCFDQVFAGAIPDATPSAELYPRCVSPLVDGLFGGYNATVFAYGQTGSGKTFTMGTSELYFEANAEGRDWSPVVPNVMDDIFRRVEEMRAAHAKVQVSCSFVEIYQDHIQDLLAPGGKLSRITVRDPDPSKDVILVGLEEVDVVSKEGMAACLLDGSRSRATSATLMNKHSSRSHAIFTIKVSQTRKIVAPADRDDTPGPGPVTPPPQKGGAPMEEVLEAKLHLVDLAGSERLDKSGAEGRAKLEACSINQGLLALGNVIDALCDRKKTHIPYRDHVLTRVLRNSLGGNSRTVMIACVSPADINLSETINTLNYAARARSIRNTPLVNRDKRSALIAELKAENFKLKEEVMRLREYVEKFGDPEAVFISEEEHNMLQDELEQERLRAALAEERATSLESALRVETTQREVAERALADAEAQIEGLKKALAAALEGGEPAAALASAIATGGSPPPPEGVATALVEGERPEEVVAGDAPMPGVAIPRMQEAASLPSADAANERPSLPADEPASPEKARTPAPRGATPSLMQLGDAARMDSIKREAERMAQYQDIANQQNVAGGDKLVSSLTHALEAAHGQEVLSAKRRAAEESRRALMKLPGSILVRDAPAAPAPPSKVSPAMLQKWVNDALELGSQQAHVERIAEVEHMERREVTRQLQSVQHQLATIREEGGMEDAEAEAEAALAARERELQSRIGAHSRKIQEMMEASVSAGEAEIVVFGTDSDARDAMWNWVRPQDAAEVLQAVFNSSLAQKRTAQELQSKLDDISNEFLLKQKLLEETASVLGAHAKLVSDLQEKLRQERGTAAQFAFLARQRDEAAAQKVVALQRLADAEEARTQIAEEFSRLSAEYSKLAGSSLQRAGGGAAAAGAKRGPLGSRLASGSMAGGPGGDGNTSSGHDPVTRGLSGVGALFGWGSSAGENPLSATPKKGSGLRVQPPPPQTPSTPTRGDPSADNPDWLYFGRTPRREARVRRNSLEVNSPQRRQARARRGSLEVFMQGKMDPHPLGDIPTSPRSRHHGSDLHHGFTDSMLPYPSQDGDASRPRYRVSESDDYTGPLPNSGKRSSPASSASPVFAGASSSDRKADWVESAVAAGAADGGDAGPHASSSPRAIPAAIPAYVSGSSASGHDIGSADAEVETLLSSTGGTTSYVRERSRIWDEQNAADSVGAGSNGSSLRAYGPPPEWLSVNIHSHVGWMNTLDLQIYQVNRENYAESPMDPQAWLESFGEKGSWEEVLMVRRTAIPLINWLMRHDLRPEALCWFCHKREGMPENKHPAFPDIQICTSCFMSMEIDRWDPLDKPVDSSAAYDPMREDIMCRVCGDQAPGGVSEKVICSNKDCAHVLCESCVWRFSDDHLDTARAGNVWHCLLCRAQPPLGRDAVRKRSAAPASRDAARAARPAAQGSSSQPVRKKSLGLFHGLFKVGSGNMDDERRNEVIRSPSPALGKRGGGDDDPVRALSACLANSCNLLSPMLAD